MKLQIVDGTSIQGSEEWLDARKKYRNASETPDVMGCGFNSPNKLKRIKAGVEEVFVNDAMRRGNKLEDMVRGLAEEHFDTMFSPQVWENGKYRASLDGLSFDHKTLVEIKVSDKTYKTVEMGETPKNYGLQVQHQLHCSPAEVGYLVAYSPGRDKFVVSEPIEYDRFAFRLVDAEWDKFDKMAVPESEYIKIEDESYAKLDAKYFETKNTIDFLNNQLKELKAHMELIADGRNIEAEFTKLGHTFKKGSVDYEKILMENSIKVDKDLFRKPSTNYATVRLNKK